MKQIDLHFNSFYLASQFKTKFSLNFNENKTNITLNLQKDEFNKKIDKIVANWYKYFPGTRMIRKGDELTILSTKKNAKFSIQFDYQKFVEPKAGESEDDFMGRCIPYVMDEGKEQDQAVAICISKWDKQYENFESITDYPQGVKDTAQRALDWVEKNGWGSCGTAVGKQRANQLAKGEPISLDTIKRMYSFLARHKGGGADKGEYGDGCGKLMYDAWGGDAALSWSKRYTEREKKEEKLETLQNYDKFYVFRLFADSSNVDAIQYDTEKEELDIRFNDGETYRYFDIDYDTFERVWEGKASCITSGENAYGAWFVGKRPSVGAALHKFLVKRNVRYTKI
jgi:hypothetical protein